MTLDKGANGADICRF